MGYFKMTKELNKKEIDFILNHIAMCDEKEMEDDN